MSKTSNDEKTSVKKKNVPEGSAAEEVAGATSDEVSMAWTVFFFFTNDGAKVSSVFVTCKHFPN